jgi:hypothetical protein
VCIAVDLAQPDIVLGLRPNAFAPNVARRVVAHVGRPSVDVHAAIDMIVSSLVTRACGLRPAASEHIGLRAWKHPDLVRVEVEAASSVLSQRPRGVRWPDADIELIEGLADRWGIEHLSQERTIVWFEIDRVAGSAT